MVKILLNQCFFFPLIFCHISYLCKIQLFLLRVRTCYTLRVMWCYLYLEYPVRILYYSFSIKSFLLYRIFDIYLHLIYMRYLVLKFYINLIHMDYHHFLFEFFYFLQIYYLFFGYFDFQNNLIYKIIFFLLY